MSGRRESWVFTVLVLLLDFLCRGCLSVETYGYQTIHSLRVEDEFTNHAVTVPSVYNRRNRQRRETTFHSKGRHLEEIFIQLSLFTRNVTLELQLNKGLFGSSYVEKHFNKAGRPVIEKPQGLESGSCYYRGILRHHPDSVVALSTCHGLRGLISTEEGVYYVEPQGPSLQHPHLVFKHSDMISKNLTCGFQDKHSASRRDRWSRQPRARLRRTVHWPYDSTKKTRVVELYITNDHQQYLKYDQDIRQVISRTRNIVNIVNSLYRPLNIYVVLVGIEIWTKEDKSSVVHNADTTMNEFLKYRQHHICPLHKNDNAQLITGRQFSEGVVGKAVKSTICSFQYSGGVNMDHSKLVGPVATTVAHEMGHNFGMQHDNHKCSCPDDRCIMAASSGSTNPVFWSSCSQEELADTFHQGLDYCLTDLPEHIYDSPTCGNGFVETGEQCDCGLPQDCSTMCCNATTCQLHTNATCATGACCDHNTCQLKVASTECRQSEGECDLAEYCDGESEFCPHDVHRRNGQICGGGQLYCYNGKCPSHDSQCKMLWGETGRQAHDFCYKHFNPMGLPNGHCGFNWINKSFKPCLEEDVLCGMLHCVHRNERLAFWKEALAYTMPEAWVMADGERHECKGAILDVGLDMPSPGMTPDGTKCAHGKMCLNQKCLNIEEHDIPECPNCHGHGTCNTLGQCHCDAGYEPPLCNKAGNGGSLHSGPVRIRGTNAGLVAGLVIFFLVMLPGIIVLTIFVLRNKQKIKKLWNGRPYKYDFIHRAKRTGPTVRPPPPARVPARPAPSLPPTAPGLPPTAPGLPPTAPGLPPTAPPQPVTTTIAPPQPATVHRKRPQSFRGVAISAPKLESSTRDLDAPDDGTMRDVGPRAVQKRPLPPIPGDDGTVSPPAGAMPRLTSSESDPHRSAFSTTSRLEGKKTKKPVLRSQSVRSPPERPPPTYRDAVNMPLPRQSSFTDGPLPPPPSYPPPREPNVNSLTRPVTRQTSSKRVKWKPALSLVVDQNQSDGSKTDVTETADDRTSPPPLQATDHSSKNRISSLCERFDTSNNTDSVTPRPVVRASSMKGIKPPLPPKPPGGDVSEC